MTRGYLLDTNHVGQSVRPGSIVKARIIALRGRGIRVGTCVPLLCEIEAGIRQVSEPATYRQNLDRLLRQIRLWPIEVATAEHYGIIHQELRRRGRVLSQVDIMLAALARQMRLTLITSDRDFTALPDVATENWLST